MMKRIILTTIGCSCAISAHAQMGWTLEQCRKHFGDRYTVDGNTAYFQLNAHFYISEGMHLWQGRQIWLTFNPDGTVGKIQWLKSPGSMEGSGFSEAEIQQHLREASRVTWKRVDIVNEDDKVSWTGEQYGKVIFHAEESDNGRGTVFLTITTR